MQHITFAALAVLALLSTEIDAKTPLTIDEVERLALNIDPRIKQIEAREEALVARSIADGQLPDPKLAFGFSNVPIDGFSLSQEPMTQLRFGVIQSIPPGDSLFFRQEQTKALSEVEAMRALERRLNVVREARLVFHDLYLHTQTLVILNDNRAFFPT